ncbi:RNA polymerase sigma factor [Bradyrhizobium sp. McL0615]|uniref:RNA polymerase sigma factor n=1 Tax=Bradyrhizobium sp. McL0615 TaxID=3415673 RepID=UPI003CE9E42E
MDHERLVRKAQKGDVDAFVELTRRFQHFAFGSALAQVHDFQQAEDIVQEAFVAAWSGLATLAEPSAFPGGSGELSATMLSACCAGNSCIPCR